MASDDESAATFGAALAVGLLGGALAGAALASKPAPHAVFENRLRARLATSGFGLASARLGTGPSGPTWIVTVRFRDGSITTVHAATTGATPFDPNLADDIASRISTALRRLVA